MRIGGRPTRSLWTEGREVLTFDQTRLPFEVHVLRLRSLHDAGQAIRHMQVRGAPLIGVTAAFGLALALRDAADDAALDRALHELATARPTAVNLRWGLERVATAVRPLPPAERAERAWAEARAMADEDVALNRSIGEHGQPLLDALAVGKARPLNVLTHCNAGWMATVDWGTALAPLYLAHARGLPIHVWVSETRPRNQGLLTAWELREEGVPHTVVADNAAGHLMQRGDVDLVLVGADRVSRRGDVCNKIGTYLKALAARAHGIPFYAALPSSTIDWRVDDALGAIPIETRDGEELRRVRGASGEVRLLEPETAVANPAFDVTPADLVTALVTERGTAAASPEGLAALFPREAA